MRTIFAFVTMMLLVAPAMAGMNTLYTSYTTLGGFCLDNHTLYFGEWDSVTALSLEDLTTAVVGSMPASINNTFIAMRDGTLYSAHDTSFSAPYPSAFGAFDEAGTFSSLVTLNGAYDGAVSPAGLCYMVVNPGYAGSRIWQVDWSTGATLEIANIGGYSGGLAFDSAGNLYYAEQTYGQIVKFDSADVAAGGLTLADSEVVVSGVWAGYLGFDARDVLYASSGASLLKFDAAGNSSIVATGSYLGQFVFGGEDTIYALDTNWGTFTTSVQAISVPEPMTLSLLMLGGLAMLRRN